MDYIFLKSDNPQSLEEYIRRYLASSVNTCIPGEIVKFDKEKQTATVRCCIRSSFNGAIVDKPDIENVPLVFPYSTTTGFSMTYPVKEGDQCLVLFSQSEITRWLQFGSVQNPEGDKIPRNFDYNDAIALMGVIPNKMAISNFQEDGIEIRNKERTVYYKVLQSSIEEKCISLPSQYVKSVNANSAQWSISSGSTCVVVSISSSGVASLNCTTSFSIVSPLTAIDGMMTVSQYIVSAYHTTDGTDIYPGVTGRATPDKTIIFMNGIAVEII